MRLMLRPCILLVVYRTYILSAFIHPCRRVRLPLPGDRSKNCSKTKWRRGLYCCFPLELEDSLRNAAVAYNMVLS